MTPARLGVILALGLCLIGCDTTPSAASKTTAPSGSSLTTVAKPASVTDPATVVLSQTDVTDRRYHALGDISVTLLKTTIFDSDPTPAQVDDALRQKAAKLGADAVLPCATIGDERASLRAGMDQANAHIAANRHDNQVAGYFDFALLPPLLLATEGNYGDKEFIQAAYQRLDVLNNLAVVKSCRA